MRINAILICGLLISGIGMVSCSSDNTPSPPSSSVERIPEAPFLISKTDQISLKEIMTTASKVWSLTDSLQFPNRGSFTRLLVTAKCMWQAHEASFVQNLSLKKEFFLFELIPKDLLLWDLKSTPATCLFEFKALTPTGSSHGFNIKSLKLTASSYFSIELRRPEKLKALSENAQVFSFQDAQKLLLQTHQEQGLQTRLLCPIAELRSRYPDEVRTLGDFDFTSLTQEPLRTKLLDNPLQICRVVMSRENGGIEKISPKIEIQMGPSPFSMTDRTVSSAELNHTSDEVEIKKTMNAIYHQPGYPMIKFEVTNRSAKEQLVGLPKKMAHESFGSYIEHSNQHYQPPTGQCVKLNASPLRLHSSAPTLKEEGELMVFKIPPQSTFSFSYRLFAKPKPSTINGYFPYVTHLQSPIEMTLLQQTSFGLIAYGRQTLNRPREIIKGSGGMTVVKNLMKGCF